MLEFLRLDPSPVIGMNVNQTLMGITAISASIALLIRLRNRPLVEEMVGDEESDETGQATSDNL